MKFAILVGPSGSTFVKEFEFFEYQGGTTQEWGKNWEIVEAEDIDKARLIAIRKPGARPGLFCEECGKDKVECSGRHPPQTMAGTFTPVMVVQATVTEPLAGPDLTEQELCALSCFFPNLACVIEREPPQKVEETRKAAQQELAIIMRHDKLKDVEIGELEAQVRTLKQTLKDWAPFVPGHCPKCKKVCSSNGCTNPQCRS